MLSELFPRPHKDTIPCGSYSIEQLLQEIKETGDLQVPDVLFDQCAYYQTMEMFDYFPSDTYILLKPWRSALLAHFLGDLTSRVDNIREHSPPYGLRRSYSAQNRTLSVPVELPYTPYLRDRVEPPADPTAYSYTWQDQFPRVVHHGLQTVWAQALTQWHSDVIQPIREIPHEELLTVEATASQEERLARKLRYCTRSAALMSYPKSAIFELSSYFDGVGTAAMCVPNAVVIDAALYMRDEFRPGEPDECHLARMRSPKRLATLIYWLASMNIDHGAPIVDALGGNSPDTVTTFHPAYNSYTFNPDHYEYRRFGAKELIVPRFNATMLTDAEGHVIMDYIAEGVTMKCPAMATEIHPEIQDSDSPYRDLIDYTVRWVKGIAHETLHKELLQKARRTS